MRIFRRLRAGAQIALVIGIFWVIAVMVIRTGFFFLTDRLYEWEILLSWMTSALLPLFGTGVLLGGVYASGLGLLRPSEEGQGLTRNRSAAIGALGGLALCFCLTLGSGVPIGQWVFSRMAVSALFCVASGVITGYGVWRVASRAALPLERDATVSLTP